jgi:acetyltransferase
MEQLLAYARAEGLKLLEGMVLSENTQMLEMCRKLGFSVTVDAVNPGLCTVRMEFSGPMLPVGMG